MNCAVLTACLFKTVTINTPFKPALLMNDQWAGSKS